MQENNMVTRTVSQIRADGEPYTDNKYAPGVTFYRGAPAYKAPVNHRDGTVSYDHMTIGDRIRFLRTKRELEQTELATRCGISQAAVSNLENNLLTPGTLPDRDRDGNPIEGTGGKYRQLRKPRAETLLAMARELGTTPEWLSSGEGDPFKAVRTVASPTERARNLFDHLSPDQQKAVLVMMQGMVATRD
jgi:DNA-binding XRE family transcriptional regulator